MLLAPPVARGRALRVQTDQGVRWLTPLGPRAMAQARRAHDALREPLAGRLRLPAWVASAEGWVVWTEVEGPPLTDLAALGRGLRALHALPVHDPDPIPLAEALARRAAPLDPALAASFADGLFHDARRVWCHRDVALRNAIGGPVPGLVDLEHARPDHPLVDLLKITCAGGLEPLLAGYGPLDDDDRERLRRLLRLHGLATLAWAERHRDDTHVAEGRAALALAGAGR